MGDAEMSSKVSDSPSLEKYELTCTSLVYGRRKYRICLDAMKKIPGADFVSSVVAAFLSFYSHQTHIYHYIHNNVVPLRTTITILPTLKNGL